MGEAFLPVGIQGVPVPARQRLEACDPLRRKSICSVREALNLYPLPEAVAVLEVLRGDARVVLTGNEALKLGETGLPCRA
jgi:hypothetical protein